MIRSDFAKVLKNQGLKFRLRSKVNSISKTSDGTVKMTVQAEDGSVQVVLSCY
jgi:L-2-hydroxyglutarate oxidase LhgO